MYGFLSDKSRRSDETSLCEYLNAIFPNHEIICDETIPKEILKARGSKSYRKFRPDVRIENLSLIVEFDGINHYNSAMIQLKDFEKDDFLKSLGYKVVRIPFYVQLNPETIKHYFDVDSNVKSKYTSGFHSRTSYEFMINPNCPANFCSIGWRRFNVEYASLPEATQKEIMSTLLIYCRLYPEELVIPVVTSEDDIVIHHLVHYDEFYEELMGYGYERIQESPYCKPRSND